MEFGLLEAQEEAPLYVRNLDAWLASVYQYWFRKGFATMVASGLTHIFTLAFTIGFSWFLFACVDWAAVWSCHDEKSCASFGTYLRFESRARKTNLESIKSLHKLKEGDRDGLDALCTAYIVVFGIYWVWSCCATLWTLKGAWDLRLFFRDELGYVDERELRARRWSDVVRRLGELQARGRAPWRAFQTSAGDDGTSVISASDIAVRIMRKENYLVGLLNAGVLPLELPPTLRKVLGTLKFYLPFLERSGQMGGDNRGFGRLRLTKTLEWSLHACVMDHVFSSRSMMLRRAFVEDPEALKRRFYVAGALHILLMPFVAAFMIMRFFLQNAQEWRHKKRYLGPREWSPVARWAFRDLNELPHSFEARLQKSKPFADAYVKLFPMPVVTTLARCVALVAGALVATLVAIAAISDDALLLYVTVEDRNLLWYLGLFSACFAAARALVEDNPDPVVRDDRRPKKKKQKLRRAAASSKRRRKIHRNLLGDDDAFDGDDASEDDDDDDFQDNKEDQPESCPEEEDDEEIYGPEAYEKAMRRVAEHTRCFPEEWKGKCHTHQVRDAFARAFRYKAWLFLDEIFSVVFAPLVLCFSLPKCADDICAFVKHNTIEVDGLGAVLADSLPEVASTTTTAARRSPETSQHRTWTAAWRFGGGRDDNDNDNGASDDQRLSELVNMSDRHDPVNGSYRPPVPDLLRPPVAGERNNDVDNPLHRDDTTADPPADLGAFISPDPTPFASRQNSVLSDLEFETLTSDIQQQRLLSDDLHDDFHI